MSAPRRPALVLTPRLPWPLDDGGRLGIWLPLLSVARVRTTLLVALVPPDEADRPLPDAFAAHGIEVMRVPHALPPAPVAALRGLFGRWPYVLTRYRNEELDRVLRRVVKERGPAFAFVNHLHLATYYDALAPTPIVLREHNVETLWMERYAKTALPPWTRAYARLQVTRMRRAERELCEDAALVLAIHDEERDLLRAIAPRARIETLLLGMDPARFRPRALAEPPVVLVVGAFGWPPNAEGLRRFLREGWVTLGATADGVKLRVVGKDLAPELAREVASAGGDPVGYVDDVTQEFARAAVLAVPLWGGAGLRVKIVEAALARLPVVATTIGAEGLGLADGVHYRLAEDPAALARAAVALATAPDEATRLADAAHAYALEHWSLDGVTERTTQLCDRVALPDPA